MAKRERTVPEFEKRTKKTRAGFVSSYEETVELWQVWCKSADGDEKRATFGDMRAAGFKRRKGG
jgi:hypothetical protein